MPELPEVETVVRALNRSLTGRVFGKARSIGRLRLPFDAKAAAKRLAGRTILGVRRRAKYIVVDADSPHALLVHLGMTGFFHIDAPAEPPLRHDRLIFPLADGEELRFADARRFGFVSLVAVPGPGEWPAELAGLGPEPLGRAFTGGIMLERARGRKVPVKVFIMDQAVVAGVGNIYASEALHGAGIDPRRPASDLDAEEWDRLAAAMRTVLRKAIRKGGSTIRNYRGVDGSEGGFQRRLRVYDRAGEACPECGRAVETVRLGGRSTFFCPECQR